MLVGPLLSLVFALVGTLIDSILGTPPLLAFVGIIAGLLLWVISTGTHVRKTGQLPIKFPGFGGWNIQVARLPAFVVVTLVVSFVFAFMTLFMLALLIQNRINAHTVASAWRWEWFHIYSFLVKPYGDQFIISGNSLFITLVTAAAISSYLLRSGSAYARTGKAQQLDQRPATATHGAASGTTDRDTHRTFRPEWKAIRCSKCGAFYPDTDEKCPTCSDVLSMK